MIKLRPYQDEISDQAKYKLQTLGMVYISMEVRTGKTFTAIATCDKLVGHKRGKVLIITKKKAISSIEKDIAAYGANIDFTVINYESVHRVEMADCDVVVIDEAQKLKQYPKPLKTSLYQKVKFFIDRHPYCKVILMSGTPSPESYSELFHQFQVSKYYSPFKNYKSFYRWADDFVEVYQKDFGGGPTNQYENADRFKVMAVLEKYFLTYTQKQSGFTNTVNEEILTVDMKPITYSLCNRLVKDRVIEGKENVILADTAVKLMQKCHQLYSGTVLFEDGTGKVIDDTKAIFIKERFKGQKIAILYRYRLELDLLASVFTDWTSDPDEFRQEGKTFLGQIHSSREGINLSNADCLVFFNIDHAAVSYFQARDRLTSKDRVKPNNVYWIFSNGGIEEKIYEAVKHKKDYTTSYFSADFGLKKKENTQQSLF